MQIFAQLHEEILLIYRDIFIISNIVIIICLYSENVTFKYEFINFSVNNISRGPWHHSPLSTPVFIYIQTELLLYYINIS